MLLFFSNMFPSSLWQSSGCLTTIHGIYIVHYIIHKSPTFLNSEAQQTQTYISFGSNHSKNYLPSYILFIYRNGLFPSDSSTKHSAPIHDLLVKATCFIGLILIDLIILTIFCEDYEFFYSFLLPLKLLLFILFSQNTA